MRQAAWAQLTKETEGAQKMAGNLGSFLREGRPVAERLFSPQELQRMLRLQRELMQLVPSKRATNPSNTAANAVKRVRDLLRQFAPALSTVAGGIDAGAASWALNKGVDMASDALVKGKLQAQFAGRAPRSPAFEVERRALGAGRRIARQGQRLAPLSGQGAPRIPLERALADEEEQP
jgi:hypothetical protein